MSIALRRNILYVGAAFFILLIGLFTIKIQNIELTAIVAMLPIVLVFLIIIFKNPIFGFWGLMIFSFWLGAMMKFADFPLGIIVDALILLIFISVLINKNTNWKYTTNFFFVLVAFWSIYIILQIFNPLSPTFVQWFYASRPLFFQFLLIVLLGLVFFEKKHFNTFITIWFIFSCIAVLDGLRQKIMWPNIWDYEKAWLARGYFKQHVLFGNLRVFSHYSDAGQFGSAMGHALTVSTILFIHEKKQFKKLLFAGVTLLTFIGLMISGTRGAIFVPGFGLLAYFIISKNFKILVLGIFFAICVYGFLAHTSLLQNVHEIRRMRTALDISNNKSLEVRLRNQNDLKEYLKDKPFGGGVGSSAFFGQRFAPDSYLASVPTDSLYVRIWVETGVVGLYFYVFILVYIIFRGGYLIWHTDNEETRIQMTAMWSGLIGIFVVNYSNMIMSQVPSSIICYLSMGYIFKVEWDLKQKRKNENKKLSINTNN